MPVKHFYCSRERTIRSRKTIRRLCCNCGIMDKQSSFVFTVQYNTTAVTTASWCSPWGFSANLLISSTARYRFDKIAAINSVASCSLLLRIGRSSATANGARHAVFPEDTISTYRSADNN